MINQVLYVWLQQVQGLLETSLKLISENKDIFIVILGVGIFGQAVGFLWWILQQRRQRQIFPDTFPFDIIKPQNKVLPAILGGDTNDPLADYKIPYQERISGRSIHDELKQKLDESRWVLILAPTGIGKTREAANLAQRLNTEGWTILHLKRGEWLDALPRFPEDKIGTDRKLLFFLDDLNSKMYGGRIEQSPKADEPLQRLNIPLQERLLRAIEFYEKSCRKQDIRVIATARNEKEREFPDEPSEWEKLEFDKYPALWKRFAIYELPEPEEPAIISVLRETVSQAKIEANPDDYACLAQRNDHTFRNIVENLRSAKNNRQSLTRDIFRDTLKGTWEKRYQEVVKKYPIAPYIYDAVELLQMVGISLYPFTVKPTALLIADGNLLRRLQHWWQIRHAWNYLISRERILQPCDGQIEAKGTCVLWRRYIPSIFRILLKLAEKHHNKMLGSLLNFGYGLTLLGHYEDALISVNKALEIQPNSYNIWRDRGVVLSYLGRHEEAITNYQKAIEFKPDDPYTWYNLGITLADLNRPEEALASYDQVIKLKLDYYQAWINRGNILVKLDCLEEALASYDRALECEPDFTLEFDSEFHLAWVNRGSVLDDLQRYQEAILSCDKALEIKSDNPSAWNIRGIALYHSNRYEEAITSYDEALRLDPEYGKAWENRNKALRDLNKKGIALTKLGRLEAAIASFDTILQSQSDFDEVWIHRGIVLANLERFEEAIASFDKALTFQPNDANAFYGKASCYAWQNKVDLAIESLQKAINLNPSKYREIAKTDSDFDNLRGDNRFQALIQRDID
ncbi:tetratricopeptide repeat protein [Coleofasciculus sp. E1-EBD-02]|uniref:tetratricopeptide repeat protein n=1 Tax=Coleofasciculus sp. E1-EBD-02 TaxID=3068481 RepID=UPI0032FBD205